MSYLIRFVFVSSLGAFQLGWLYTECNQMGDTLSIIFDWDSEEYTFYSTLLTSIGILGCAIGSIVGGDVVQKGRRRAMLIFNGVASLGCMLMCI